MKDGQMKPNALISVFDKTGIAEFAGELAKLNWKIYASGGTAEAIKRAGVDVTDVAELTGGSAILGHKVVTLSREIHAGILAGRDEQEELEKLGIPRIDLVCVGMYPLQDAIQKNANEAEVIEKTDIGGPTMLRAAAKGRRIVIARPEQRQEVLKWLKAGKPDKEKFLRKLAAEAELEVARYVLDSAKYLGDVEGHISKLVSKTKYGENPWQQNAGLYASESGDPLALSNFKLAGGSEPSYNNYTDIDRLLQTITHIAAGFDVNFDNVPAIALGAKHGNVCGAAVADDPKEAIKKMLEGDLRAIFGGSVMVNFPVDKEVAKLLLTHKSGEAKRLIDVVVAPEVSSKALEILQRKGGKLRVMTNPSLQKLDKNSLDSNRRSRYIRGGFLVQSNYTFVFNANDPELEKHAEVNEEQIKDMVLAWAIGSTSNSNTVCLVMDAMLIGNGVGQQDRVGAAELAIKRAKDAGHEINGAAAYSDSFFPFPDGAQTLADAGVSAILATRGSINDAAVADALKKANIVFYSLPDSSARGFYAH